MSMRLEALKLAVEVYKKFPAIDNKLIIDSAEEYVKFIEKEAGNSVKESEKLSPGRPSGKR